jgi:uncharacterized membrane protein YphA (DoxX/SURF4 family)
MKSKSVLLWVCRIVAAVLMLQTLYYKFSGSPESVYIFSQVGMEPEGRFATAVAELIASILILIPTTSLYGAFFALFIMIGAIGTHLFIIGIEVKGDHGQLFIYALIVSAASVYIIIKSIRKRKKVTAHA